MADTLEWLNTLAGWATAGALAGIGLAALKHIHRRNLIAAEEERLLRAQEEHAKRHAELLERSLEKQQAMLKELLDKHSAWLQAQSATNDAAKNIKLELFSRRYEVYTRLMQFCELVKKRDGKLSRQDTLDFAAAINHAQFLFDAPAWEYIAAMRDRGARLNQLYETIYEVHKDAAGVEYLAARPVDPALNSEFSTLIDWFLDQPPQVQERMMPYLDFRKLE